ncbi:MAG TPA: amidohydrolase family protein [Flavobacteriaceae bacterium]|nr:amidohydrolase family protein [Flavobacteriaceae bacterium]MCB9212425.1 amidohydrolase family protein [Alteromonas sp.]HPF11701.1 amidohydrolase family protein [Flavobacteriaceae bacterium]HQU20176.1 amidohydrolase family protein [Flavobacteriaceae bacterium]HQU64735.1 amidohydrolase family protein [Flavobacteriaceae bacterium]
MKKYTLLGLLLFLPLYMAQAQVYFPKNDGVKEENNNYIAFTNATLHITPNQVIPFGTLLVQHGKIVASGKGFSIPANTVIVDLEGKHLYPSFIDCYTAFGVEKPKREGNRGRSPQYDASREGFYWNDHIRPEVKSIEKFKYNSKDAEELRKLGFGVINTHLMDGIARGTGVLVALNDEGGDAIRILEDASGQYFSFEKSVTSNQSYPTSLMGAMALLRQMYYDRDWYAKGTSETKDLSLEALIENRNLPAFFEAGDKGNDVRADGIGNLFNIDYIIVGGGNEYETIENIKQTKARYVIPIDFPEAFDVSDPYFAKYIALEDLREWNQAPQNPKVLSDNGINFALTTFDLKKVSSFSEKLEKAFLYGFDKTKALEALTTIPAQLLNQSNSLGTLEKGKWANFLITSGPIFEKETIVYENWVQGQKYVLNDRNLKDIRGSYTLAAGGKNYEMSLSGEATKPKIEVKMGETEFPSKLTYENNWITFSFTDKDANETYLATAKIAAEETSFSGRLVLPNGLETSFTAIKTDTAKAEEKDSKEGTKAPEILPLTYPNVGYGYRVKPKAQNILFKNATVWTSEAAGILENTDVLVKNGKIEKIGKNLNAGGATVIDATGKHLTAGIIDEHSHIATLTINEAGQNSSAEVKISDVVNPEDINIYRNLAGGVTSIQILHGSANPIGGRSALIKLKWGEDANGLLYKNSPKFIKFALGENVKQSNWQSFDRFPQTRMGVEQVYVNYFNRAKEYDALKKSGKPYRYDEELEVLAEILNGERFISCHSYVQSEINMLMKVAEHFGFKVNTFTHILEGYKVADKMAQHGVGGSTFSDWWAYKYEVNDAIPYNAAIMTREGVTTAINSDDDEMSRRLNQEAAKTIKYGAMSEEEAWKMVTINPAQLLHLDDRVGSVKEGKDADLVLWSDNPLSIYAKAEKTMIDGSFYFDLEVDKAQREAIQKERSKLIQMMLEEKSGDGKKRSPMKKEKINFECETIN